MAKGTERDQKRETDEANTNILTKNTTQPLTSKIKQIAIDWYTVHLFVGSIQTK